MRLLAAAIASRQRALTGAAWPAVVAFLNYINGTVNAIRPQARRRRRAKPVPML